MYEQRDAGTGRRATVPDEPTVPAARRPPSWAEFDERPVAAFEPRAPAAELAAVLQRLRDGLDAAGRAGAESRVQGLRALAEQAVLAVELEELLNEHGPAFGGAALQRAHDALAALKDRMLAHVASAGLEVVRLAGAGAGDVLDIVEVDSWCYDAARATPVVVTELEAAIRLDGAPLRRGRVVMAGPCEDVRPAPAPAAELPGPGAAAPPQHREAPRSEPGADPAQAPRIVCPIAGCGAENAAAAEVCVGCLTPLAGFSRLSSYPEALFNEGLRAARQGDSARARDHFAAVVLWHPHDVGTRNALALACLETGDAGAARTAWDEVLRRAPGDALALRGLAALSREDAPPAG